MNKTPLYVPPVSINTEEPAFHGDLFNRENLAKRLTDCIDRLPNGGVIAIDAPWGEGKSWFGQHWHNKLKADGYRTAFINAFERDYVEEPFVMLVSELMAGLEVAEKSKLKASGIAVAKALAPLAAKSAINALAQLVTGTTNFSEKIDDQLEKTGDAIAAGAEKLLAKQIEDYEKSKVAVAGFRKTLGELAAAEDKPIVIFVDELDRCRPEFAVRLIERVKHFFEMPNVIFVLLINKDQFGKAVKGCYGGEIDAERYLSKFFHLSVTLPKSRTYRGDDYNLKYCKHLATKYGFVNDKNIENWCLALSALANVLDLSYRDLERCTGLLALSNVNPNRFMLLAWPVAIKVCDPDLFQGLLRNTTQAHEVAYSKLERINQDTTEGLGAIFEIYSEIHQSRWKGTPITGGSRAERLAKEMSWHHNVKLDEFLLKLCQTITLDIN
jgi:KAP family P-loop domain